MAASPTESRLARLARAVAATQLWRSIFRHGWLDTARNRALEVTGNVFLHLHPITIPRHALSTRFTFCLGGLGLFLFLVETVTGVLLMFYYRPVLEYAYLDMKSLGDVARFGLVLRNLHRWGAHLMVVTVMLHMLRVFLTGSYRPPREFNWVVGVSLLVLTLLLSFTGYLLPWDQLAIWAVTVGMNMAGTTPLLGDDARLVLLGGLEVSDAALIRFYTLHVIGLPLLAAIFMAVHFWRIRRDGGLARPL